MPLYTLAPPHSSSSLCQLLLKLYVIWSLSAVYSATTLQPSFERSNQLLPLRNQLCTPRSRALWVFWFCYLWLLSKTQAYLTHNLQTPNPGRHGLTIAYALSYVGRLHLCKKKYQTMPSGISLLLLEHRWCLSLECTPTHASADWYHTYFHYALF